MRTCRLWKKFGELVESAGKPACKPLPFVRGSYARHAVLESLHAGSGKYAGKYVVVRRERYAAFDFGVAVVCHEVLGAVRLAMSSTSAADRKPFVCMCVDPD